MKDRGLYADLVIDNGTVITVDSEDTVSLAVAVKDGVIIRVGDSDHMAPLIGTETQIIDATGKTVIPGFIDFHTHNVNVGDFSYSNKRLNAAGYYNPTIPDLISRIKDTAKNTPDGDWAGAKYFNPSEVAENRWPTKEELDAATPDNPFMLTLRGGNACVLNSLALEAAGITKDTSSPTGGLIEKDPQTGEPTGYIHAKFLVKKIVPQSEVKDIVEGLGELSDLYVSTGVTSSGDSGAIERPESFRGYQEAIASGKWKIRTYLNVYNDYYRNNDIGLRTGFGDDRLKLGAIKLLVDGSIQCLTASFYEPYLNKETRGLEGLYYSQEELNEIVAEAHRLGYQLSIDAQGDYAVTMAVDAVEYAMEKYPRPDPRHRLEHLLCATVDDLKRMNELGIIATFFIFHPWYWGDDHINEFIGKERANKMIQIKSAMELGLNACIHSDCPVSWPNDPSWPSNPLWGIWCAVTRKTRSGVDIGPQEKLTPMEALRAYTINGAYGNFEEDIKGSIEVGKLADIVVLSDNPLEVDPEEIKNINVEKTIIGGEIVYEMK